VSFRGELPDSSAAMSLSRQPLGIFGKKKGLTDVWLTHFIFIDKPWCRDPESNWGHADFQSDQSEKRFPIIFHLLKYQLLTESIFGFVRLLLVILGSDSYTLVTVFKPEIKKMILNLIVEVKNLSGLMGILENVFIKNK
jgi:hypothetical protein